MGERLLLFDAMNRSLSISEQAGTFAIEVLAIDDGAKAFTSGMAFFITDRIDICSCRRQP